MADQEALDAAKAAVEAAKVKLADADEAGKAAAQAELDTAVAKVTELEAAK